MSELHEETGEELEAPPTEEVEQPEGETLEAEGEQPEGEEKLEDKALDDWAEAENLPKGFVKTINRKHWEKEEERRRADAAEEELNRLKAMLPEATRPVIPELPDPYDANYADLIKERDEKVQEAAAWDFNREQEQKTEREAALAAQQKEADEILQDITTYDQRAGELGIDHKTLKVAADTISAFGIAPEQVQFILKHESGPKITTYLAKNPGELSALQTMTPMQAGAHMAMQILPKALAAGGPTPAPDPVDSLGGGGAPPQERGPKGATYE